ncbi:MAG TPA: tetratricopeptide repeat protein [Candidatus Angelobacter sp.]|jgi:hypothetical protein
MNKFVYLLLLFTIPASQSNAGQTPSDTAQLQKAAERSDAKSQFELGQAYENGRGLPQDDTAAAEWFRKAADQGNAQAQNSLGVMFALGRGVQRDKEEAVRWYKKGALQGLPEAIYNVAISYYNGEGVDENLDTSYAWMMVAHEKGDQQAAEALQRIGDQLHNRLDHSKLILAGMYEKGDEIPQDMAAAMSTYLEIAQHNSRESPYASQAQYKLCIFHAAGVGVPQDYAQAKSWCKKSASGPAYFALGRMAEKGFGQERNPKEAIDLYRDAALLGISDGYMETARLKMESGTNNEQKNAYFWYAIAARLKITGADTKLSEAATHLDEKEIQEQQNLLAQWVKMTSLDRIKTLKKR